MNRPQNVTIIAIVEFCLCALFTLLGVGLLVGGGFVATILRQQGQQYAGVLGTIGAAAGIFILVCAAIWVFVLINFWNMKNWARIVVMVFAVLSALQNCVGVLGSLMRFSIFGLLWNGAWGAFWVWTVMYLNGPEAKNAFSS